MRGSSRSPGVSGPAATFSLPETMVAAVAMVVAVVTALLVVAYPVVAFAAFTAALAARVVVRTAARVRVRPRTSGRWFAVRVPFTDLYVEV